MIFISIMLALVHFNFVAAAALTRWDTAPDNLSWIAKALVVALLPYALIICVEEEES